MKFKKEKLVEREIEIAGYLLKGFSLKQISEKTGLGKKHLIAHIQNMMKKLEVENMAELMKILSALNF